MDVVIGRLIDGEMWVQPGSDFILVRKDRMEELEGHREENGQLREVVRAQGEFIQSIKEQIAAFRGHPPVSLGRAIADRGLRG